MNSGRNSLSLNIGSFGQRPENVDATGRIIRNLNEESSEEDSPPSPPPKKPEPPQNEENDSECEELREEMDALQAEKSSLENEINSLNTEIETLEQETQKAFREFVEIAAQYESSRIPTPNNIANYGLGLIWGGYNRANNTGCSGRRKSLEKI